MTSGTQSPPLEATGEHKPMGISSVNDPDAKIEVVPDSEQRARTCSGSAVKPRADLMAEYFQEPTTAAQKQEAVNQKVRHHRHHITIDA
jgi:hypothetical protein